MKLFFYKYSSVRYAFAAWFTNI